MKVLVLCVLSMLIASNEGVSVNCRSEPETNDGKNGETAVDDGQSFTITCDVSGGQGNNINDHIKTCSWEHYETENENRGNNYEPDTQCNFAEGNSMDSNCNSDQRLRGQTSKTSCQLTVQNSIPDDTGDWTVDIFTDQKSTQTLVVYTYNQSYVEMLDDTEGNRDHRSSVDTKYNWNDKQNDWEKDESNYESVELICYAAGGRPLPVFVWSINNDDLEDDDVFDVSGTGEDNDHSVARSYGYNNIIQDMESTLKFTVNPELLERLRNKHNVDTNPDNGDFSFDIDCQVEQDGVQTSTESMRIDVQKSHDDGHLKGSMIGIIVGCIVAVILLVAAIALLVFAKASNRWCFSDEDYQYRDPKSRDNRPRGPGPQGPQGPQAPQQQQRGRPR